ncbi:hypothetical protein D3C73_1094560 [compost metagenome]
MRRDGCHRLAALEQVRQRRKVGGGGADPSTQAQRRQPFIGDPDKAARRHQNVLAGDELLEADGLLSLGQTDRVDQTQIISLTQHLSAEQTLGKAAGGDRQVDTAFHQGLGDDLAVGLAKNQPQSGRAPGNFLDQAPAVGDLEVIRKPQGHGAAFEMVGHRIDHRQALPAFVQGLAEHRLQLVGLKRGCQAATGAHE